MADTIAVMNEGQIEQAGSPPTSMRARAPSSWPTSSASPTSSTPARVHRGGTASVETHDGAKLACPRTGSGRTAPTPCGSACAPRRSRSCPAARTARVAPTSCAAPSSWPLPRRLDPVRDPGRRRRGADRVRPERRGRGARVLGVGREVQLAWMPQHTFVVAKETSMPNDPRFERALEEFFTPSASPDAGSSAGRAPPASRWAASPPCSRRAAASRAPQRAGRREEGRRGQPPQDRDRQLDVLELAALHRQARHQGLQQEVRRQVQVRRGDQRQLRVLREDPPAARAGQPIGRDIITLTDYLASRCPPELRRADRQEEHPNQVNMIDNLRPSTTTRTALLDAVAVRRDRPRLQHQEDRARTQDVKDLFDPKFKGRVTMLTEPYDSANTVCWRRRRRVPGDDRPDPRRDREDRQGQPRRPVPPLHRQRLHDRPRQGQRLGLARLLGRPDPAAVRQPGPALRLPRGGRDALHGQHDDAGQGRAPLRGRDDDELRLRARGGGQDLRPT